MDSESIIYRFEPCMPNLFDIFKVRFIPGFFCIVQKTRRRFINKALFWYTCHSFAKFLLNLTLPSSNPRTLFKTTEKLPKSWAFSEFDICLTWMFTFNNMPVSNRQTHREDLQTADSHNGWQSNRIFVKRHMSVCWTFWHNRQKVFRLTVYGLKPTFPLRRKQLSLNQKKYKH